MRKKDSKDSTAEERDSEHREPSIAFWLFAFFTTACAMALASHLLGRAGTEIAAWRAAFERQSTALELIAKIEKDRPTPPRRIEVDSMATLVDAKGKYRYAYIHPAGGEIPLPIAEESLLRIALALESATGSRITTLTRPATAVTSKSAKSGGGHP